MTSSSTSGWYHVVPFEQVDEAAAFVAALSRFLNSPVGSATRGIRPRDVWASVDSEAGSASVYLSDGALDATSAGFGSPPISGWRSAEEVTSLAMLLLEGDPRTFGQSDILQRMVGRTTQA